ncbi:FtsK/SpoIIIE domain-containing protein [Streptomyces sp. SGAir0957]
MADTHVPANTKRPSTGVPAVPDPGTPVPFDKPKTADIAKVRERRRVRADRLRRIITATRTNPGYRLAIRHGSYIWGGTRVLTRRAWDSRTTAMHTRMMRQAELSGNEEAAMKWEQRAYAFRFARHRRRIELLQMVLNAPKAVGMATAAGTGMLLILGVMIAAARKDVTDVFVPLKAAIDFVSWVAFIAGVVWRPFLWALPWLALAGVWGVGRHQRTAPAWALPTDPGDLGVLPDENAILQALENIGVAPFNKARKEGWQPRWLQGSVRSGNGYHAQLQLPQGVTVEMINKKKTVLASNLLRKPIEVWPTEPDTQPGVLDLWVADQGSLSGKIAPWPLLTEGTVDYFKGVPVAVSQRGEPILGKLAEANYLIGGIMGQGKSSLVVTLLLGALLDPIVEAEVYCMAYNVDFDPMKPRLRTLVKGDDDEAVEAALDALRRLADEVSERGQLLEAMGGKSVKLTRELAVKDDRMRPKVVIFDECHELFGHKKHGKEAGDLATKVIKKARKCGITLIFTTVSPTADSIPKDVTRNTSNNVAFAVGDYVANDGLLGTGKYRAGISATTLIPFEHIGTAVTTGFTRKPFEVIRCHYVARDPEKGIDEVTPVVERALKAYKRGDVWEVPETKPVDHLTDIATVHGHDHKLLTQDVLKRLADHNPAEYGSWTFRDLRAVLDEAGHGEFKTGGRQHVSLDRILDAIAARGEEDGEDDE